VTGHHAIIPTVKIQSANISELKQGEQNILALVAAKLLCAAGMPYKYKAVNVIVDCENHDFTATGKVVIESGWKETYDKMRSILPVADSKAKQETTLPKMSKGNTFTNVKAVSAEHWTAPPKPYTEDTLLSAMEHAGQENYDENTEKKGLGTPATRAAIIEALVKHEYAERKGKQITSTQKGVSLIAAVPSEMKSAELTAEWETTLQNIERGKADKDEFMNGIVRFTKELCEKYGSADNSLSFSNTLGKCPKCGSEILHGKFGYYCKGRCGMNVAKVYGKELTQNQLSRLLSGKETSYTVSNRKTTVLPEIVENTYNGKSTYQWKTK
jgi:DNA topoisomerase-3